MTTPEFRIRHDIHCREEVVCEKPLLTVDRQMGLNIVHPDGKVKISSLIAPLLTVFLADGQNNF